MSYYDKYIKYKKKYLALKGGAGGESKSGESKSGESKSGAEAKSSENFLDRPHLVAIVRYTEYNENVPENQDKITEILFSDGNVYKAETYFYEAGFGDIETEGRITLERSIVLHQKESKDLISFLGGIDNYYYYKTIEDFYQNTPHIDIYLTKKYNINGKYKSKILFNKVIKDNKYDFDTGYTSITGNMISLEGDKLNVGDEFDIVKVYPDYAYFNPIINDKKEIMHIDEYIERQMHEDYMRLKEVDLQLNKYEKKKNNIPCRANQTVKECNDQPNCKYSTLKGCTEKEDPNKNNPASKVFNVGKSYVHSDFNDLVQNIADNLGEDFNYEGPTDKYWDDDWDFN